VFNILPIKLKKKSRKYPVKRDQYGRSARQRAFDAFDRGMRPAEVSQRVGISPRTACRYFADWKKLPKNLDRRYRVAKAVHKGAHEFSEQTIKSLAGELGMSEEEAIERLQKPWGLKQLLMGKWPNYAREKRQSKHESRLQAALKLIRLYEVAGVPPERIIEELDRLKAESRNHKTNEQRAVGGTKNKAGRKPY